MFDVPMSVMTSSLEDLEVRPGLREPRLEAVRRAHAAGAVLNPIAIRIYPSGLRRIGDGNHRLAVARADGWPTVRVRFERMGEMREWRFYEEARKRGLLPDRFITAEEERAAAEELMHLARERGGVR